MAGSRKYGRCYFRRTGPTGFYSQAQLAGFHHRGQEFSFDVDAQEMRTTYSTTSFSGFGAGLGVGYQWLPRVSKHFVLDAMVDFKVYLQPQRGYCDCHYEGDWYNSGPGSAFNGRLGGGYAF